MTASFGAPTVFDADLPRVDPSSSATRDQIHAQYRAALAKSPIVMGPQGPEVVSYEAVQKVLRDSRFTIPQGLGIEARGVTSGPLWERVATGLPSLDGAEHLTRAPTGLLCVYAQVHGAPPYLYAGVA